MSHRYVCKICGANLIFDDDCVFCALRAQDVLENSSKYKQKYEQNNAIIQSNIQKFKQQMEVLNEEHNELQSQMDERMSELRKWKHSLQQTGQAIQEQTHLLHIVDKDTSNAEERNRKKMEQIKLLKKQMQEITEENSSFAHENRNLKKKVNKLLDDKKEQEIKIFNLEKELKHFASQNFNLDESKFMEWDHKQLLLWIQRLDNGYFNKYIDVLSIQLKECELSGKDLKHLTTADIRGLGVKKFADAKKLEMYVKKLLGNENKNDNPQIAIQQKEGIFATNYI